MKSSNVIRKLLNQPEKMVEKVNLKYMAEDELSICRKRKGKGFSYLLNDKPITKKKELRRIKKLVIPPAWDDVKISSVNNAHLQATGIDQRKRKQYIYHPEWSRIRNEVKFYKMFSFGKMLPLIRQRVDTDLRQKGWPDTKVMALILKLMEETHIRIGSDIYAKHNKTYGLSTLRSKHVNILKDKIRFEFTGKKGIKHKVSVKNKKLIKLVSQCEEIPGWNLFQYYDKNGQKRSVDSGMVNEYIKEITGDTFTAKDFRTWSASIVFFDKLMELGIVKDEKLIKKNLIKAFEASALALRNTRSVCKKYYVHPLLISKYEDGSLLKSFQYTENISEETEFFSASEHAFLNLIKNYHPNLSEDAIP